MRQTAAPLAEYRCAEPTWRTCGRALEATFRWRVGQAVKLRRKTKLSKKNEDSFL